MELVRTPGAHLVPGGPGFVGYDALYVAHIDDTVLVYCPEPMRPVALDILRDTPVDDVLTVRTCERIAGGRLDRVDGPAWHGFTDRERFEPAAHPQGERISPDDDRLAELRRACGEQEWAEAGFSFGEGVAYSVELGEGLVAAGNMTPFRGRPADVGLLTHPGHRGRGLARGLASRMIGDALPEAGVVRYRSRTSNPSSLAVARSLGFVGRGENLVGRLRP